MSHPDLPASAWVTRWAPLVGRGPVLDLASGSGRHSIVFLKMGLPVVAVDREAQALPNEITFLKADLEDGRPWPFAGQRFGAIVVTNYLYRPLLPVIAASLEQGGLVIYETFMQGNEKYGRPSNPDFLLRPGELLESFRELSVIAFEQGYAAKPKPAVTQRLCARRAAALRPAVKGIESAP